MADGEKTREAAGVRSLDDGKPQQEGRLQDGDDTADHKGHAVEVGDLAWRQIEGAAEDAREHKHPGHAEDVLQTEDQKLARGKSAFDADVEDSFRRWNGTRWRLSIHVFAHPMSRTHPANQRRTALLDPGQRHSIKFLALQQYRAPCPRVNGTEPPGLGLWTR